MNESGCSDSTADRSSEIARARKRRDARACHRQLAHPLWLWLGAEHNVPDSRRNAENSIRLFHMMRQMPRPQPCLNRTRRCREMYPVMHELIDRESSDDSEQKDHS